MVAKTDWINGNAVGATDLNNLGTEVNTKGTYTKPGGGIPSTDLTTAIQTSLGKADTATQPADLATAQLMALSTQTTNYTLILGDANKAVEVNSATAVNVTIPTNATVAYPVGTIIEVLQVGAGQVTIVPTAGVTINTPATLKTRAQWSTLGLRKRATNTWVVLGDAQ